MSELKPCPKCETNGAPLRRIGEMDEYRVECVECYTVRTPWFKTILEAEVYWNAFAEGMEQQAARIAELEKMAEARKLANRLLEQERNELEAECDRLRKVAEKLVWLYSDEYSEKRNNGLRIDGFYSYEWLDMILNMAREALKGAGE